LWFGVGKSGSGKTSLADIISGINKPSSGTIEVDKKDFYDFNYDSLRSKICYVPQENMLLNLSIKENIL
jgi:ABC-type bacteriocin/lantibiotic exporter with double-glycine peptidase domain